MLTATQQLPGAGPSAHSSELPIRRQGAVNDRGPYGTAYRVGARLDLALGAAQRIGMHSAQYVYVSVSEKSLQQLEAEAKPEKTGAAAGE
jgi:hypothetical protein